MSDPEPSDGQSPEEPSFFEIHGIAEDAPAADAELFAEIKQIVHHHVTKGGHDYTPDPLEYRASSMGVCSRKILLEKDLTRYLDEETIASLPPWYHDRLEGSDEPEFGAHISGQVIHEAVQEALADRIISMEEEVSLQVQQASLKGHYDLLIEDSQGEKIVIDIKSTRTPRKYLPNEKHLKQLMAYQGMMGGIKGGLLYVDRNSFEMSYITQDYSKEAFSRTLVKINQMANYEQREQLPPPIPEFDWECITRYYKCQFYDYCFPSRESIVPAENE